MSRDKNRRLLRAATPALPKPAQEGLCQEDSDGRPIVSTLWVNIEPLFVMVFRHRMNLTCVISFRHTCHIPESDAFLTFKALSYIGKGSDKDLGKKHRRKKEIKPWTDPSVTWAKAVEFKSCNLVLLLDLSRKLMQVTPSWMLLSLKK